MVGARGKIGDEIFEAVVMLLVLPLEGATCTFTRCGSGVAVTDLEGTPSESEGCVCETGFWLALLSVFASTLGRGRPRWGIELLAICWR
jgi:hypothetical protein